MATAKRRQTRRVDDDDFDIALDVALAALLKPGQITPGARWSFRLEGQDAEARLVITRSVSSASTPDPDS